MHFIRDLWYVGAWSEEVTAETLLYRKLLDEPILLTRRQDGQPAAISNVCPHRLAPLHMGQRHGDTVRCGYHGLEFDLDGRCTRNPNSPFNIPAAMQARRFPVVERHTLLWVWMGDGEPDERLIPDFSVLDDTTLSRDRKHLTMNVNVELIANNLLDLSHASFLHEGLLATPEHAVADIEVTQAGHTVVCSRKSTNVPVPQVFDLLFRRDKAPVDFWNVMRWDPPYSFLLDVGCHAPGATKAEGAGLYGVHILTPQSGDSTHYFVGIARKPVAEADADAEFQSEIARLRLHAFVNQDQPMLETMQSMLGVDQALNRAPVLIAVDAGPVRMKRVLEELARRELRG